MAHINRRPPFMFRLAGEMDRENDTFFFIKKEDVASMRDVMSPLINLGRVTFGANFDTTERMAKAESLRLREQNKM